MNIELSAMEWQRVERAVRTINGGGAKRVEGENWKVYIVENCIRIDIHENKESHNG